jgi:hypothetical protein
MKISTINKFGSFALITGSLFLTIYAISFSFLLPIKEVTRDYTALVLNSNWMWIASVAFIGVILMIFGFLTLYSRMQAESGLMGFLGFLFVEIAYILQACIVTWEICLYPIIAGNQGTLFLLRDLVIKHSPIVVAFRTTASITIFIGVTLFCIALMQSKVFSKMAGVLIFVGALLYGLGPILSTLPAIGGVFILSIGCLILGKQLIRNNN